MKHALVIGSGPSGLMAADTMAQAGLHVTVCDQKPSFGRKFLMAGKSGLNLTKNEPLPDLMRHYYGASDDLHAIISDFAAPQVTEWAQSLGQGLFTGSTGRVFPDAMKASPLLRAWLARLDSFGVERRTRFKWLGWEGADALFETPDGVERIKADVTVLALGGASWARLGSDGVWVKSLTDSGAHIAPFVPSNAALAVEWSDHMQPHMGAAIKSVAWQARQLRSRGEGVISRRGLEGGGLYSLTPALREGAPLFVDLIPDVSAEKAAQVLDSKSPKLRLAHWLKNTLRLPPAKVALFFEMVSGNPPARADWVKTVKALPVRHAGLRPMDEAISTAGGVTFDSLTPDLMMTARPGVFCAGEMLDWEAPTGGYLITASLATGRWAGLGAVRYLAAAA